MKANRERSELEAKLVGLGIRHSLEEASWLKRTTEFSVARVSILSQFDQRCF